jgi:precorrin-2 dehydrogenase/sirohydrochlorin ferrochelatase
MADRPPVYPVKLVVAGRRCLVVGGGAVAASKAVELLACGAVVHVVASEVGPEVAALEGLTSEERPYRAGEVEGYRFVVAATDDPGVNRAVFLDGERHGVWVNSADDPESCSVMLPARIRRGPLLVTFATGGASPALARWLRRRFEPVFGPEYEVLVELVAAERARLLAEGRHVSGGDWQPALDSGMLELIREGNLAEAKERLQACLSSSSG